MQRPNATGRLSLKRGDPTGALEAAERAHALDPSNERPVQLAMEAEGALGRRVAVVERYEQLRRELDEQFGLEPSRSVKLLYRRLLSQDAEEYRGDFEETLLSPFAHEKA